jgi:cytochrome c biogenesis protein CcmG/thiol:disulfide interchange protein DsbE
MVYRISLIVLLISATVFYTVYQKHSLDSQLVQDAASTAVLTHLPNTSFETLDGDSFSLKGLYEREKIGLLIIHYWGTWCGPCEAELPDLLKFIKRFEGRSEVKFLIVAVNDDVIKVKKHLKALPIPVKASIAWLVDNKNIHRDIFGTTRVPETYVFSSDMTTLRKYIGPQEWNKPMFFQTFDEFIQISTRKL